MTLVLNKTKHPLRGKRFCLHWALPITPKSASFQSAPSISNNSRVAILKVCCVESKFCTSPSRVDWFFLNFQYPAPVLFLRVCHSLSISLSLGFTCILFSNLPVSWTNLIAASTAARLGDHFVFSGIFLETHPPRRKIWHVTLIETFHPDTRLQYLSHLAVSCQQSVEILCSHYY